MASMTVTGTKTLGVKQTFAFTKPTGYAVELTYRCGSEFGTAVSKTTSNTGSFTPPISLASQNVTGKNVTIIYTLTSYLGPTKKDTVTYTHVFSIPDSIAASCSIAVSDDAGYANTYGGYVQRQSRFKIDVTPDVSNSYGAAVISYKIVANGSVYTEPNVVTDVVRGSNVITAEVTDSRGFVTKVTETVTVLPYARPKISSMSVVRTSDTLLQVTFSAEVSSLNGSNSATYTVRYQRISGESHGDTYAISEYTGMYSVVNGTYSFWAHSDSSYNVWLEVRDNFTASDPSTISRVGPSATQLFSIYRTGKGWAFGKTADTDNAVDFGWDTYHRGSAYFNANMKIYGKSVGGAYKNVFEPTNDNDDNTTVGYGNYDHQSGMTNVYGHDVGIGVSNVSAGRSNPVYRPYYRHSDEIPIEIATAGYVTNAKEDISFTIPLSMPVIGNPVITIRSNNGIVIRQDNKYLYGSSADSEAHPTSYSAALSKYGIRVTAHFAYDSPEFATEAGVDYTIVTNNAPVGIYWSGYIIFS